MKGRAAAMTGGSMKASIIAASAVLALGAGMAQASPELAKSSGCLGCHDVSAKKMGPSFKSIAEKYKGKADAEATIDAKLAAGKGHPAVKVKEEDRKTLVKWVLSQ
jgi:cytochrome c